jgi:hypothetical protein
MVNFIQRTIAKPTAQLFNTLYQWEQVGQSPGTRKAAQQTQGTGQQKPGSDNGDVSRQFDTAEERKELLKLGAFLEKASAQPSILDDTNTDYRPYRDAIEILANKLKK